MKSIKMGIIRIPITKISKTNSKHKNFSFGELINKRGKSN